MLTPTHVQVAVLHTKDLVIKGKNGANDAFIIYSLGKEKYQSSVKEKASQSMLVWNEGCDIAIPSSNGNKAELVIKVMCKASIGDKFLGRISLPLSEFDVTGKAKPMWYPLKPKVGSEKDTKYRGEIEVRISFLIKSSPANASTNELSKSKRSGSFKSSLGSILSLGKSKKKKKDKNESKDSLAGSSTDSLRNVGNLSSSRLTLNNNLPVINDDPGVISEEEDEGPLSFKIDRKKSIQSTTGSESVSESVTSTPKSVPKPILKDIFKDSPPVTRRRKKEPEPKPRPSSNNDYYDNDDGYNNETDNLSPLPTRTARLPSVIVEEPQAIQSSLASNNDEADPPRQQVPGAFATLPRHSSPSKLSVSASMSNLLDPSNNGKGSVRKTIKSMFSSSKHLSVDEIFLPLKNGEGGSPAAAGAASSKQNDATLQPQQQPQFPGAFFMKRRDSARDLGIPKETYKQYEKKSKEELVAIIVSLQGTVSTQKQKIGDLEDYIDKLLLRVLDNMPALLTSQNSIRRPQQ